MPTKLRAASAVAAACLLTAAAACSAPQATPTIPAGQATTVRVSALSTADDVPLYIAQEKGLFAAQGIKVTIRAQPQSNLAIPDLNDGRADVQAGGNLGTFFQAADRKQLDLRVVAEGGLATDGQNAIVVPGDSPITSPAKLAHATVAINNPPPNVQSVTLDATLRSLNVNPAGIHYVSLPFPDAVAALSKHTIDAAWFPEPFVTLAEQQGAKQVLTPCSGPTANMPLDGYYTTGAFAERNPDTVRAFRTAIQKASAMATDHQLVVDTLTKYVAIKPAVAALIGLPNFTTTLQPRRLQRLLDLMYDSGAIHTPFQATKLVAAPQQ